MVLGLFAAVGTAAGTIGRGQLATTAMTAGSMLLALLVAGIASIGRLSPASFVQAWMGFGPAGYLPTNFWSRFVSGGQSASSPGWLGILVTAAVAGRYRPLAIRRGRDRVSGGPDRGVRSSHVRTAWSQRRLPARSADRLLAATLLIWALFDVPWWWRPPGHSGSDPGHTRRLGLAVAQSVPFLWRRSQPGGGAGAGRGIADGEICRPPQHLVSERGGARRRLRTRGIRQPGNAPDRPAAGGGVVIAALVTLQAAAAATQRPSPARCSARPLFSARSPAPTETSPPPPPGTRTTWNGQASPGNCMT